MCTLSNSIITNDLISVSFQQFFYRFLHSRILTVLRSCVLYDAECVLFAIAKFLVSLFRLIIPFHRHLFLV